MSSPSEFLNSIEDDRVVAAIHRAKASSGATIRVHISHQSSADPTEAARRVFHRAKKRQPNKASLVVIFVAPPSQTFALYGDSHAHAAFGAEGWKTLTDQLAARFKVGEFGAGLIEAVESIANRIETTRGNHSSRD